MMDASDSIRAYRIADIQTRLSGWYGKNRRNLPWRNTLDPYRIWLSEVMLQQTRITTVVSYYNRFLQVFPNIETLARADMEEVLKVWEGLGYYARARNFHRAAGIVMAGFGGEIPSGRAQFMKLPGVGEYIASAVLSIAFNQKWPVVDGNVKRILSRLFQIEAPVNQSSAKKTYDEFAGLLLDSRFPGNHNQAVMELGQVVCKAVNPLCGKCPIENNCISNMKGEVDRYPKRIKKRPVPRYFVVVAVIHRGYRVLLTKRKPEGLLGGLWEFPGGKIRENESAEKACIREIKEETGLEIEIESFITSVKHAYTHFKIDMSVFRCRHVSGEVRLNGPVDFRWIYPEELGAFPLPGANHKFIHLV